MSEEIMRNALKACSGCLNEEHLMEPETDAEKMHLASCLRCQAELKLMNEFLSGQPTPEEAKHVDWIARQLAKNPVASVGGWKAWFTLPRLSAVSLAMAALLVVISLKTTLHEAPVVDETGANISNFRSGVVKLNTPTGDVAVAPQSFTWEAVPNASKYRVRLMEVDQNVLWSTEIYTFSIAVPADIRGKIVPAKTLLWQVDALDASGRMIASSSPERFRVAP